MLRELAPQRQCFLGGMRRFVVNWEETTGDLIRRVQDEAALVPQDAATSALLADILSYPGVPPQWRSLELAPEVAGPLLTVVFRKSDQELRFFSTFTTFSTHETSLLMSCGSNAHFPPTKQPRSSVTISRPPDVCVGTIGHRSIVARDDRSRPPERSGVTLAKGKELRVSRKMAGTRCCRDSVVKS
jgi:hypothetical protein